DLIIHQNNNVLKKMDGTVREMHEKSGLTEKVRASNISEHEAEDQTLNFIKQYVESKSSPLCGNSIYMDRTFISKYFPEFEDYLHYRLIDVSTIKELYKRWFPQRPGFKKKKEHRALDDIKESIAELKFYRENIFISPS
ncbi:MAG: oligoribonuclease, partial [Patescibacteria group bacterium]|nr:oligoribonuclease [Patescibacteria group bacterium]